MLKKIIISFAVVVGLLPVHACLGPDNIFGVRFNDQESIDVSVIERMGEYGINYLKEEKYGGVSYSFRSHYNPSIMVDILLITSPTVAAAERYSGMVSFIVNKSEINLEGFPFDSCTRIELDWLAAAGVIEMTRIDREKIERDYSLWNKVGFYWTKQDTLSWNDAEMDSNGVIRPSMKDCGGEAIVKLPPQYLTIKAGIAAKNQKIRQSGHTVYQNNPTALFVDIRGRMFRQQADNRKMMPCGVLLQQDRSSGIIKRIVAFP